MRWVTYRKAGNERVALVVDEEVRTLKAGVTLIELVAAGLESLTAAAHSAERNPDCVEALSAVDLAPPIPRPPSIRDCLCFLEHMRNCQQALGAGRELKDVWYQFPGFYFACPSTVLGPYDDFRIAPGSQWQDFELEVAAVIGQGGQDLSVAEAEAAIIGYTILNDWSARDLQQIDSQLGLGQGKGKDSGMTLGPALVTPDELAPFLENGRLTLTASASVNGTVVGSGSTGTMDWLFPEVISYASRGVPLHPGDVFGSGTVPTCTLVEHVDVQRPDTLQGWLTDGDIVQLDVEILGSIRQTVRASSPPCPIPPRAKLR